MNKTHHNTSLYFIVIGLFLLLISGTFLSEGMARIGLDNAVVAKKMASGFEDFWLPSLNDQASVDRSGYLPLGYWLQSKWFQLFGDSSYLAEKFYSVFVCFLMGLLVVWIWKLLDTPKHTGWLPLFCIIMIPLVSWSATSNLLEGTMTLFVELAIIFVLLGRNAATRSVARHVKRGGGSRNAVQVIFTAYPPMRIVYAVLAAVMLELAFMVKGVMGLFPILFPLIYWVFTKRERLLCPLFSVGVMLGTWVLSVFAVVLFSPTVYGHLYEYLHHQLIGGVLHVQTVASHIYILYVLVVQLAIPLSVFAVLALIRIRKMPVGSVLFYGKRAKKRKVTLTAEQLNRSRMGWVFFTTGMAGVLPIMLGLKQQDFYIVPTLPFFAISLGCFFYNLLEDWLVHVGKVASRLLALFAVLFFVSGLLLNLNGIHKFSSNTDLLRDMKHILPMLDEGETISVSPELMQAPEVGEYFYRYKDVNFTVDPCAAGQCTQPQHWNRHLLMEYSHLKTYPEGVCYQPIDLPTRRYFLYELIECAPESAEDEEVLEETMDETNDETKTI